MIMKQWCKDVNSRRTRYFENKRPLVHLKLHMAWSGMGIFFSSTCTYYWQVILLGVNNVTDARNYFYLMDFQINQAHKILYASITGIRKSRFSQKWTLFRIMTPCHPSGGYHFFGDRCWQHFRRKAKMEVEGRVDNSGESLNGSDDLPRHNIMLRVSQHFVLYCGCIKIYTYFCLK
jgi:hypothetical protein